MIHEDIAQKLAHLTPKQRALFMMMLREKQEDLSVAPIEKLVRGPGPNQFPMSLAQQRQWVLYLLAPESSAYNIHMVYRLKGVLQTNSLEASLQKIEQRHEILRTSYAAGGDGPVQIIAPEGSMRLTTVDLCGLSSERGQQLADQHTLREIGRPFNLQQGPMWRALLLRLPHEHRLVVCVHHIAFDGWSMIVFARELATVYQNLAAARGTGLAPLAIQYADHAQWQRKWLEGGVLEKQLAYWKNKLAGIPHELALPSQWPRPVVPTYKGRKILFSLSRQLSARLVQLSRNNNATPFMTLLAAWQTLLFRYSGQREIAIGSPVANRKRPEVEPLLGFFVNTLVLRTSFAEADDYTVKQLLAYVRQTALEAYEHQDVPFEKLVEELQPERSMGLAPLFQVLFTLQEQPPSVPETGAGSGGLSMERINPEDDNTPFDICLFMVHYEGILHGNLQYNSDMFTPVASRRMVDNYIQLLEGFVTAPDTRISQLDFLKPEERHQLLITLNEPDHKILERGACIHELFEKQATLRPDATALIFEGQKEESDQEETDHPGRITYSELNVRANRIAHFLIGVGSGPEVPIGIFANRGPETVIGILAILKAGSSYVPLDPSNPDERLKLIVEDAQIEILLTQASLDHRCAFPAVRRCHMDMAQCQNQPEQNPLLKVVPENLAYIIYTSGSTGRPKGVTLPHQQVIRLLDATQPGFQFGKQDIWTLFHSCAFDFSVWELWGPLTYGGSLVMVPYWVARSPKTFLSLLWCQGVTVLNQTPSAFQQIIPIVAAEIPELRHLRLVIFGGEALIPAKLAGWFEATRGCSARLVNMYGITETTVHVTSHRVVFQETAAHTIPIGRPIADLSLYLLDTYLNPVTKGVPGEICVTGPGLARGYLGRAGLTAERFLPNPFGGAGSRLYRSGDLASYDEQAQLNYMGRSDRQVKLRGFRIELGEIEAVLASQTGVNEVAVLIYEETATRQLLLAYVVADAGAELKGSDLRKTMAGRLPDYMIPSQFIFLDRMPTTTNGKLNRKALPKPDQPKQQDHPLSLSPLEEMVAAIWAEVLELERVGAKDHFFELGGHSLSATRVVSQIRETFGVELPLSRFFAEPRLDAVARRIQDLRDKGRGVLAAPQAATWQGDIPLAHTQQIMWLAIIMAEDHGATFNIPFTARLSGWLDLEALARSLSEIVARHETLRTHFVRVNGRPTQQITPPQPVVLGVTDFRHLQAAEAQALLLIERENALPFELERDRLFRVRLFRLADNQWLLSCTMHHLVCDGWSLGIWTRELGLLYQAYSQGQPSPLPPLPIQYADFVHWQTFTLGEQEMARQLAYWKTRMQGAPALLELPLDKPRPEIFSGRGGLHSFRIGQQLRERLQHIGRKHAATPFIVLQTAFAMLLKRYSGQDNVVIGTSIANRHYRELEGLIGLFTTVQAMHCDLSGDPVFSNLLEQLREQALEAHESQDLPFEALVEALRVERNTAYAPIFQVMLVYQNSPFKSLDLAGIELRPLEAKLPVAKYDLTLFVYEEEQGLAAHFEYSTDLFHPATLDKMAQQFLYLLEDIVADPMRTISAYALDAQQEAGQNADFLDDLEDE